MSRGEEVRRAGRRGVDRTRPSDPRDRGRREGVPCPCRRGTAAGLRVLLDFRRCRHDEEEDSRRRTRLRRNRRIGGGADDVVLVAEAEGRDRGYLRDDSRRRRRAIPCHRASARSPDPRRNHRNRRLRHPHRPRLRSSTDRRRRIRRWDRVSCHGCRSRCRRVPSSLDLRRHSIGAGRKRMADRKSGPMPHPSLYLVRSIEELFSWSTSILYYVNVDGKRLSRRARHGPK
mmetsp:Transcript_26096/g.62681  ORF Transcript_26096/g.62681 Transcript_26096/m.62681 type:complete len:230 (-) Transcript_26096:4-693(-)